MSLKKQVKTVPKNPGVYFFKNKYDDIIYIGKAKNLRSRVSSYFNKNNKDTKTAVMISNASSLEYLVVSDEVEAIITEANMIKQYKPRYNVFLKDDKTFPYIIITNEPYPRVEIIRKKNLHKDGNMYFGPYTDVSYLREVVKALHRIFPIRTCSYFIDKQFIENNKAQVCLDYHIKKCQGPCEGLVSNKDYIDMIESVVQFLKGRNKDIKNKIKSMMSDASAKLNYEEAARLRDQLIAIDSFSKKQKKIAHDFNDRDILHVSIKDTYGVGFVMRIRNSLLIGREKFDLKITNDNFETLMNMFLIQYYNSTFDIPPEIVVDVSFDDLDSIESWLTSKKGKKVKVLKPIKGDKRKMLDLCIKNSNMVIQDLVFKKIKRKEYAPKILSELQEVLSMPVLPKRIEAFDNSNIQGKNAVAGMVCFVNGKPLKKEYRKFNIKTVEGIDDFESMREVVFRRYSRQIKDNAQLPDLILIDGGKGQLSAAKSSLDKLGLGYISIIGIAKKLEEVFLPSSSSPQNISKTSPALYLLRKIRDEVHRYAITFHRSKRKKDTFSSVFNDIKGMGPNYIKKIWSYYESLEEIKKDSIEAISEKTKIPLNVVANIKKAIK
ncbi:MAG: excinuclease ABC subunit C [Candidatus Marinimicrobia bacterium]|nr:excinuclease ABC subunit C [Candidatus Neomarinimicrobiota bacterium]|tara:strand:- start:26188 stop:28002 length:1815 start_codon:yes stop_codon:yes gene_type:complete